MITYNVLVELIDQATASHAERLLDSYADYHPAVARTDTGHAQLIITLPADSLIQAATTALALIRVTGHRPIRLEVLSSDDYDRRTGLTPIPDLLSVREAADRLGISRQAVLLRIQTGTLQAKRVGTTYAVPMSSIP